MYVAVKGGEAAIANAHRLLADRRRGDRSVPALRLDQIVEQLALAVDRVMARRLALRPRAGGAGHRAGARRPDRGDLPGARLSHDAAALRLYAGRSTPAAMLVERRVSATYKDLPGGQMLGPTFDYTHRLLDPELADGRDGRRARAARRRAAEPMPRVSDILAGEGPDRGRRRAAATATSPATSPASRWNSRWSATSACRRWRAATRASCWRSAIRRSAAMRRTHPFVGEIRIGEVEVELDVPELGFAVLARPHPRHRMPDGQPVQGLGQGAAAVHPRLRPGLRPERAQGDGDGAVRPGAAGRANSARTSSPPAQDEEFVISHSDNVQATGFVEHLKLPHYVDFQAELDLVRRMRAEHDASDDADDARRREAAE